MPNLSLIQGFHKKYGVNNTALDTVDLKMVSLNEAIDPDRIEKAILNINNKLGIDYMSHFYLEIPADVVLMFIDICSFSTRFKNHEDISGLLDKYYDLIIPVIYKHGGEIDKIIGDGIICFFGPPFSDKPILENLSSADRCAKEILKQTNKTDYYSKIAIHDGEIIYYRNKSGFYNEYTIIGQPITELFRLESIAEDRKINFYSGSGYDRIQRTHVSYADRVPNLKPTWGISEEKLITRPLKGAEGFTSYKTIRRLI